MKHFQHILAGWLIDGSGGPVRRNVLLSWEKETLTSLKEVTPASLAESPVEILGDFTILPGLVDSHVHLSMSGTEDPERRKKQRNATFEQARETIERHIVHHITRGVVALRDGGDCEAHVLKYKKRSPMGGPLTVELRSPGWAWHAPGRYGRLIGRTPRPGETLRGAIAGVMSGSDHVKIVNSGVNSLTHLGQETAPQFVFEELREAVEKAHGLGLKVMVHANGRVPVGLAVEAGCDSIEHGFFMGKENLEKMAERKTIWVPTAYTMAAYASKLKNRAESDVAKRNLDHQLDQIRLASELGVSISAGTDSGSLGVNHGEALSEELRLLMIAGFTLEEAVRSASSRGAALLNAAEHTGALAPGRPATFVAVKAAPEGVLDGLKMPRMVVVKGKVAHRI